MRHGRTHNHLGRTNSHRSAMLSNMACSLIEHKRIETTLAKARELRRYVEPLLTKAKTDSTHSRRTVFSYLQSKEALKELFGIVAEKIGTRPGGYTRIIKLNTRMGDNADLALIELVDFNELMLSEAKPVKTRTRRSRRSAGTGVAATAATTAPAAESENIVPTAQDETVAEAAAPEAQVAEAELPAAEAAPAAEETSVADADTTSESTEPEAPKGEGEAGEVA